VVKTIEVQMAMGLLDSYSKNRLVLELEKGREHKKDEVMESCRMARILQEL